MPTTAPKLSAEERAERDDKILEWRFVYSFPVATIAAMINQEQAAAHAAKKLPGPPPEITAKDVKKTIERKTAEDTGPSENEARLKARLRYEGLFKHLWSILKRQASPEIKNAAGVVVRPRINAVDDRDGIAAARAAAIVQQHLDRLAGIDDGEDPIAEQNEQINLIVLGKQIISSLGDDENAKKQVRSVLSSFSQTRKSAPLPDGRRTKRNRMQRG